MKSFNHELKSCDEWHAKDFLNVKLAHNQMAKCNLQVFMENRNSPAGLVTFSCSRDLSVVQTWHMLRWKNVTCSTQSLQSRKYTNLHMVSICKTFPWVKKFQFTDLTMTSWYNQYKAFRHVKTLFIQGNKFVLNQNKPPCLVIKKRLTIVGRIKFLHVEMPHLPIWQRLVDTTNIV